MMAHIVQQFIGFNNLVFMLNIGANKMIYKQYQKVLPVHVTKIQHMKMVGQNLKLKLNQIIPIGYKRLVPEY